jgi:hypothetical protein
MRISELAFIIPISLLKMCYSGSTIGGYGTDYRQKVNIIAKTSTTCKNDAVTNCRGMFTQIS